MEMRHTSAPAEATKMVLFGIFIFLVVGIVDHFRGGTGAINCTAAAPQTYSAAMKK